MERINQQERHHERCVVRSRWLGSADAKKVRTIELVCLLMLLGEITSIAQDAIGRRETEKTAEVAFVQKDGDASLSNKYLTAVMAKGAELIELNYPTSEGFTKACNIMPVGAKDERCASLQEFSLVYGGADKKIVDIAFIGNRGSKLGLRLIEAKDNPFVEAQPLGDTVSLRIEHSALVSVMPDVRGNDLVIRPEKFVQSELRLPFSLQTQTLNFIDDGNAIVSCVWQSALRQQATLELHGAGRARTISATTIGFNKITGENVWVAVLAEPGIWHQLKMDGVDGKGTAVGWKDRPLDSRIWWRADFRRDPDGLIESWFVIRQGRDGNWPGCLSGKGRTVWCTYCSNFTYPAYVEGDGLFLANTTFDDNLTNTCYKEPGDITFNQEEPVIIYPYMTMSSSSRDQGLRSAWNVFRDALSDTRDATLYERIYSQRIPTHRFSTTCGDTKIIETIFEKKQEIGKADEVIRLARHLKGFVWSIRERVEEQVAWADDMRKFCAERKVADPRLTQAAGMFDETLARVQAIYQKQLPLMKTPTECCICIDMIEKILLSKSDVELIAIAKELRSMNAEIKQDDENNRVILIKSLGSMIRRVGGSQDAATGRIRQVVKALHQQAGIASLTASEADTFDFISEVRIRTTAHMAVCGQHEPGKVVRPDSPRCIEE